MKKITSIKVTNAFVELNILDSGKYKISEDDYLDYKFKANMEVDDKLLEFIKKISNYHMAYLSALNKIKYKDRSEYEIKQLLYDDFTLIKPDVDKIIAKLKHYNFINDDNYTLDLIFNSQSKYYGYNKIKTMLINVKINSGIISKHLIFDYAKELDLASQFASKSLRSIRNKNKFETEKTLRQKLLYRGFTSDVVNNVINDLNITVDKELENTLLKKEYERVSRRYQRKYEGYELRVKLFNFLLSKGYSSSMINNLLDEMENSYE